MIEIKKSKEPRSLTEYKKQVGASYENMSGEMKDSILESLLVEQGHLCAYCMKRLSSIESATIEHWYPRHPSDGRDIGQGLDYKNMLAVCSGNKGCKELTCDAKKGNREITVNPCKVDTLRTISYKHNGTIFSSDPIIDNDLNENLNLNCEAVSLPKNRKQALDALINMIKKDWTEVERKRFCRKIRKQIQEKKDPKLPYVGILIWWLEKHS